MKIYAVGGSVRDKLMGIESNDNDYVVVGSTPEEMISLGYKQVGAAFPVFLHPETGEEYALARTEKKVGVGYNGFECEFNSSVTIEEDLMRRDLTINAIAVDLDTGEYVDPYGGRVDIDSKTLKHVSDAFGDDPLRVVRLTRFYARFDGFVVHFDTIKLVMKLVDSGEMDAISDERYWAEIIKVFSDTGSRVDKFFDSLRHFGVIKRTKYFKSLLGDFYMDDPWNPFDAKCEFIHKRIRDPEFKAAVFVALFENKATLDVKALPNRVGALVKNFRKIKAIEFYKAEDLYGIIANTRSLSETTPALMDLVCCLRFAGMRELSQLLLNAAFASHDVKADDYMNLTGAAIGVAMKKERLLKISLTI